MARGMAPLIAAAVLGVWPGAGAEAGPTRFFPLSGASPAFPVTWFFNPVPRRQSARVALPGHRLWVVDWKDWTAGTGPQALGARSVTLEVGRWSVVEVDGPAGQPGEAYDYLGAKTVTLRSSELWIAELGGAVSWPIIGSMRVNGVRLAEQFMVAGAAASDSPDADAAVGCVAIWLVGRSS